MISAVEASGLGVCAPDVERLTVLLVEDEPLIRSDIAAHLWECGYEVIEAATAEEAVELLRNAPCVSAVFTDVNMPGTMSGWGLARWIQRERADLPTIVTSAVTDSADMRGAGVEACAFVPKPYDPSMVERLIRDVVQSDA